MTPALSTETLGATRTPASLRGSWRTLALVVLAVVAFYALVVGLSVRHYGGNLSSLIEIGQRYVPDHPGALGRHVVVFRQAGGFDGLGYDGQTFYYVAGDPFLRTHAFPNPFRYQRIVYPLLIWAVSLGQRDARPLAMAAINIVAVAVVALLSGLILLRYGRGASPWWALACAINPSLILGVQLDLAEPLMIAFSLAGLLLYLRRRVAWSALAFAVALMTRDAAVLFLLPPILAEVAARRARPSLTLALSVVPYLVWQAVLARAMGHAGARDSVESNFGAPFAGIGAVVAEARHTSVRLALVHEGSIFAVVALILAAIVVAAWWARQRYDVVLGGILTHGVAALFASSNIMLAYASAARVFGGLYPLTIFAFTRQRTRAFAVLAAVTILLTIFTFIRLVVVSPTLPYYVTP